MTASAEPPTFPHLYYMVKEGFSYWYKALLFTNLFAQTAKLFEIFDEFRRVEQVVSGSSTAPVIAGSTVLLVAAHLLLCVTRAPAAWRGIRSITNTA